MLMDSPPLHTLVIRFSGDSGDGMQLAGNQFTNTAAIAGNDVNTFPDFPAEIRAPAGTVAGVSGFQVSIADHAIHTAGDQLDILIALNPAALKANLADLRSQGILIINRDTFTARELQKAGFGEDFSLDAIKQDYNTLLIPLTELTLKAVSPFSVSHSQAKKCKNMFALGVLYWLCEQTTTLTEQWITDKFKQTDIAEANRAALLAGFHFAETAQLAVPVLSINPAELAPGEYRQITGNAAISLACVSLAQQFEKGVLVAGYPITPASGILEYMAAYQQCGVATFQAEDEIAAICAAIGASYGGALGITCTSGPGFDLKTEALGLAVMVELPLIVIDVQRAGGSTGMPTKTEQSDLLMAIQGRHGESPVAVIAAQSPSDCFQTLLEAASIAISAMTPVIVLSDASLANGAEPWCIPSTSTLPNFNNPYAKSSENFSPYARNEQLSRPWAIPGTPTLMHRVGGLEKQATTGEVSYDPDNHQTMVALRQEKINLIAERIAPVSVIGDLESDVLIVSWGSTYGAVLTAVEELQQEGKSVAFIHLRWLNPFPANFLSTIKKYKKILVPELNSGQLAMLLNASVSVDITPLNKITGKPFLVSEIKSALLTLLT